ncbi:MAG: PRC-barrel domain-containing protein [Thermomicrobiales bacterium]|nr:PRC-barrel domain-containing protein [Thermomicrobiales bacterium]
MNISHLKGLPVLSVADGERLGAVSRVYLDLVARRMVGIGFDTGGGYFGPAREPIVDVGHIQALGHDALLLPNREAVDGSETDRRYVELVESDDLINRTVLTAGGRIRGSLSTLGLDERTFAITGIEIARGHFRGHTTIPIADVLVFGRDYVVTSQQEQHGSGAAAERIAEETPSADPVAAV